MLNLFRAVPFKAGHVDFMNPRNLSMDVSLVESRAVQAAQTNGEVLTILHGALPVAILGVTVLWPGVAEVWSIMTDDIRKVPVAFHRFCERLLRSTMKKHKLHRAQCNVRGDFTTGLRWAEALGFQREGLLRQFGPDGSDYILFARTTWPIQ